MKNLKKCSALALVLILAFSLVACGKDDVSQSQPDTAQSGSTSQSEVENINEITTSFFGKISGVAGNELSVDLANVPGADEVVPESDVEQGDEMFAVTMTPATAATEAGEAGAQTREELEYTGESKDFVIPAALKIMDTMGNEKQLSDLKKGSVLTIFVDENGTPVEVLIHA